MFTTYGWFVVILFVVGLAILGETILQPKEDSGGQAIVGIGMGAGIGLMQWAVLRHLIEKPFRWFWYSLLGFSLSYLLFDLCSSVVPFPVKPEFILPFATVTGALFSGWLQHRFILREYNPMSIRWLAYTAVGWLLAHMITMSMMVINMKNVNLFPKAIIVIIAMLFLCIGGPILGFVTGHFMVHQLDEAKSKTND